MEQFYDKVSASAAYIRAHIPQTPTVGIILGSGLGGLVDAMTDKTVIPYGDIPHFPCSTVAGHAGNLVIGRLGSQVAAGASGAVSLLRGLQHEGGHLSGVCAGAAGGKDPHRHQRLRRHQPDVCPRDLMLLSDHINMLGTNSLIGPNDERFGPRFPDMTEAYPHRLREKAHQAAGALGFACKEGVYAIFPGPCYETAAEIRAYEHLGADAIGMSTVPEVIAANYLGMAVLGIACITNMATGIAREKHSHQEVLRIANESSQKLCALVECVVREL